MRLFRRPTNPVAGADDTVVRVPPDYAARFVRLVLVAVVLGLVMSYSASFPRASRPDDFDIPGDSSHFLRMQAFYALIGLGLMYLASKRTLQELERWSLGLFGFWLFMMVVAIIMYLARGTETAGSRAWFILGPIRFQPSEFAKVFYVAYMASLLGQGPWTGKKSRSVRERVILATGIFCLILLAQKDQGMTVLIFCLGLSLCFLGGLEIKPLLKTLAAAFTAALILAMSSPERRERIWAWLDPLAYIHGAGYHIIAMLVATSRGWLVGQGLGMSPDKWVQMPTPYTDSIFCVMGGEIGLLGCTLFLVLLGYLVHRCFEIGRWSELGFGYFLACGVGLMWGIQAVINMFVAVNFMPVTGLTLPFISYGGSSLVSCLIGAGLVLAVYAENPRLRKE